jgi:DNA helicase-2/ATP-dependent DNA helicase PcrA
LRYLRSNPTCPERAAYEHVIVDEYQDLNRADQVLLDLLSHGNAVVIGDENQSIYRFRYAHPDGIKEYSNSHPETLDHDLDECRRCPKRVVELANHLILNNHPESATPKLIPSAENPEGEVHIVQWKSMADEAQGIAQYIKHLIESKGYKPGEIMVLCGRRVIAYQIRDAVAALPVPIHSFFQEEALDSAQAQMGFAMLTLLASPEDRVALRYLLGCKSPSWLKGEYSKLRSSCESAGPSPMEALESLLARTATLSGVKNLVHRYKEIKDELEGLKPLRGRALLDKVAPDQPENKVLRETILPTIVDDMKPARMVDTVRSAVTQPQMPEDGKFVRIMSLQKSKGLTSKAVIVTSCVEGILPVAAQKETPAEQAEILQEQRRLFYVSITRPTDILVISSFANITPALAMQTRVTTQGQWRNRTQTSRFIAELGPAAPAPRIGDDWRASGYNVA